VAGGLAELNLRELLGLTLSTLANAERSAYLSSRPDDKGNGRYGRALMMGSMPLSVSVPRTRSGDFRPSLLPERYQRGYPEETQGLLMGLLASSRSISAAKAALSKMGLPCSASELDQVASEFIESVGLRNEAPIDPDQLAVFIDAKYVDLRDGDRIRPATIYVVVALGRDGKKRILCCEVFFGRESLDDWKKVLRHLLHRGLRRVMALVQDDFPGLLKITQAMFPGADVQLCTVHCLELDRMWSCGCRMGDRSGTEATRAYGSEIAIKIREWRSKTRAVRLFEHDMGSGSQRAARSTRGTSRSVLARARPHGRNDTRVCLLGTPASALACSGPSARAELSY
jgi:hypothetical protein